jgi:hypothetical protein
MCFLIYIIRNQFFNNFSTYDNKIANKLFCISEVNINLTIEIEKNKACIGSITAEIKRILTDIYKKLSTEINTKITNEFSTTHLFKVNSSVLLLQDLAELIPNLMVNLP